MRGCCSVFYKAVDRNIQKVMRGKKLILLSISHSSPSSACNFLTDNSQPDSRSQNPSLSPQSLLTPNVEMTASCQICPNDDVFIELAGVKRIIIIHIKFLSSLLTCQSNLIENHQPTNLGWRIITITLIHYDEDREPGII